MVYLIDELEDQALAERVRSPQDRRAFLIHLTPSGRHAQRKAATALAGAADTLLPPSGGTWLTCWRKWRPTGNRSAPASRTRHQADGHHQQATQRPAHGRQHTHAPAPRPQ
jgi:DNA-binding MarR family transcriptional regulator